MSSNPGAGYWMNLFHIVAKIAIFYWKDRKSTKKVAGVGPFLKIRHSFCNLSKANILMIKKDNESHNNDDDDNGWKFTFYFYFFFASTKAEFTFNNLSHLSDFTHTNTPIHIHPYTHAYTNTYRHTHLLRRRKSIHTIIAQLLCTNTLPPTRTDTDWLSSSVTRSGVFRKFWQQFFFYK